MSEITKEILLKANFKQQDDEIDGYLSFIKGEVQVIFCPNGLVKRMYCLKHRPLLKDAFKGIKLEVKYMHELKQPEYEY